MTKNVYDYHLGIYSKLIRGGSPDGPIKPGVEAKMIGHTLDFPSAFHVLCTTSFTFPSDPPVTKIDARRMPGGAFVYVPVMHDGKLLSAFSRIEARPERGKGQGGRKFTHCATLIVRDKWEPGLISWAARMLFSKQYSEQADRDICWGEGIYEKNEHRTALKPPELSRYSLVGDQRNNPFFPQIDDMGTVSRIRLAAPDANDDQGPDHIDMADWWAGQLEKSGATGQGGFAVTGRFLSFACGISDDISGPNGGFYLSIDSRQSNEIGRETPLGFNDAHPPFVGKPETDTRELIPAWRQLGPFNAKADEKKVLYLNEENYWSDQQGAILSKVVDETPPEAPTQEAAAPVVDDPQAAPAPVAAPVAAPTVAELTELERLYDQPLEVTTAPVSDGRYKPVTMSDISWPRMMKHLDHPTEEVNPISRDAFDQIGHAFSQLYRRLDLIDAAPFDVYPSHDTLDRETVASFRRLLEFVVDFAASGEDPNDLRGHLDRLFAHPSLPGIGVWTDDETSLTRYLFIQFAHRVGAERILNSVDEIARRERSLAGYQSRREQRNIQVGIPDTGRVTAFFEWLLHIEPFEAQDRTYDEMYAVWWHNGLEPYFLELYAGSDELFGQKQQLED